MADINSCINHQWTTGRTWPSPQILEKEDVEQKRKDIHSDIWMVISFGLHREKTTGINSYCLWLAIKDNVVILHALHCCLLSSMCHLHFWKLTSGMKPISFRWLLSSGSWKAIIWEKTVKYSETQAKGKEVNIYNLLYSLRTKNPKGSVLDQRL